MNPYNELANAIVIQAYKDYIECHKKLRHLTEMDTYFMDKRDREKYQKKLDKAQAEFDEVYDFFFSDWYECLTSVDPKVILAKLDEEVAKQ